MQTPLPAPHGSASHSFTSEKDPGGEMSQGVGILGRPGATHSPALTHAVAVLRVRSVAGIAVTGVVRGARDALSVATDVLVQAALICLWEAGEGEAVEQGAEQGALTFCHGSGSRFPGRPRCPIPMTQIPEPDHTMTSGPCSSYSNPRISCTSIPDNPNITTPEGNPRFHS